MQCDVRRGVLCVQNKKENRGGRELQTFFQRSYVVILTGLCGNKKTSDLATSKGETKSGSEDKMKKIADISKTNTQLYRCCVCNKDYPSIPILMRHIKYHMSRKTVVQPEECLDCGKVFTTKQQLTRHEASHKDVRPFKCGKCEKLFKSADSVKRHMYVHSDAKPFSCSICSKEFKAKHLMKKHEETHSDAKNYECPKCGKTFKARNSLRDHLLVHNGTRPYKCDECDRAFYRRSHLATHKTVHSQVKPFPCSVCEKRFGRREHLKVHERIHSGEKPFKCNQCERSFNQQAGLQAHLISHSDERPYICAKCGKAFKYLSQIKHHACKPFDIGPCMVNVQNDTSLMDVEPTAAPNTSKTASTDQESENNQTTAHNPDVSSTSETEDTIILIEIQNAHHSNETAMSVDIAASHENQAHSHDANMSIPSTSTSVNIQLTRSDAETKTGNTELGANSITPICKSILESVQTTSNTQTRCKEKYTNTRNFETRFASSSSRTETQGKHGNAMETQIKFTSPAGYVANTDFSHATVTERCNQAGYAHNANPLPGYETWQGNITRAHQYNTASESVDSVGIATGTQTNNSVNQACMNMPHAVTVGSRSNSSSVYNDRAGEQNATRVMSDLFHGTRTVDTTGASQGMLSGSAHLWNRS